MFPSDEETYDSEDLREVAKEASREAIRATQRALGEPDYDDDEDDDWDDDDDVSVKRGRSVDEIKKDIQNNQDFDIFVDVGEELAKEGLTVKYRIYRGGKMLTEEEHPYSWIKLQQDRGSGHYKVVAIHPDTNRYIKQQTQTIDHAPQDKQSQVQSQGPSVKEIMSLMNEQNEKFKAELKENQREKDQLLYQLLAGKKDDNTADYLRLISDKSDETMKVLLGTLSALKPQDNSAQMTQILVQLQQSSQQQQMESQKLMLSMVERLQTNTNSMIKEMNDKFERGLERLSMNLSREPEKPEFDAFRVMQLTSEAEERTERRMREMYDLVEAKSHEKAEFLSNKEPQSAVDKVISSLAPLIGPMMAGGLVKNVPRGAVSTTSAQPVPTAQRKAIPNNGAGGTGYQKTAGNPARGSQNTGNGPASRQGATKPSKKAPSVLDTVNGANEANVDSATNNATIEVDVANRDFILQTSVPLLLEAVQTGEPLDNVVVKVYEQLTGNGVVPESIERDVTPETIEILIKHYELPEDMSKLLREFYVRLIKYTDWQINKSAENQEATFS